MPYRGLCVIRCAPLEIVVPRQEEISGAATAWHHYLTRYELANPLWRNNH